LKSAVMELIPAIASAGTQVGLDYLSRTVVAGNAAARSEHIIWGRAPEMNTSFTWTEGHTSGVTDFSINNATGFYTFDVAECTCKFRPQFPGNPIFVNYNPPATSYPWFNIMTGQWDGKDVLTKVTDTLWLSTLMSCDNHTSERSMSFADATSMVPLVSDVDLWTSALGPCREIAETAKFTDFHRYATYEEAFGRAKAAYEEKCPPMAFHVCPHQ